MWCFGLVIRSFTCGNMRLMQAILCGERKYKNAIFADWAGKALLVPDMLAGNGPQIPGDGNTNLKVEDYRAKTTAETTAQGEL